MAIDAGIYSQIQQPQQSNQLANLAQAYQLKNLQRQGDQQDLAAQQQNKLLQLVQDPAFSSLPVQEKANRLQGIGAFKQAGDLVTMNAAANKDQRAADVSGLDMKIKQLDAASNIAATVTDQESYNRALPLMQNLGYDTSKFSPQYDPRGVAQFAQATISAKERLAAQTQMRGQDMTQQTALTTNANTVNATTRGQDLTDARQRETNANGRVPSGYRPGAAGTLEFIPGGPADPNTKPAGGKPLNDTQAKALQFGSRMQNANEILDKLAEKGVNVSTPGSTAGYGIGAVVNALQPEDRQQLDQAKRDFINAVLRRESGAAISPTEFDSAEKQYFPQTGEGEKQRAQKKAARELSMRGILAEVPDSETRVAQVRGTANTQPVGLKGQARPSTGTPDVSSMEAELKRRGLIK